MNEVMQRALRALTGLTVLTVLALLFASACVPDLGECDQAAADEVVYGRGGLVATKGQALIHDSCGNAAFCHSKAATGSLRYGVPKGLDFDMLSEPTGWQLVRDHDSAIWKAVFDGDMPPRGIGAKVQGDGDWLFDSLRSSDARKLPPITSQAGKAAIRNWLACGAPVVSQTHVPDWVRPQIDGGTGTLSDWSDIYDTVIGPSCSLSNCHGALAAGGLKMTDACSAYKNLKARGDCSMPRLVPGDGSSALVDKLESDKPTCGTLRMPPPPLAPLPADVVARIRTWVESGAPAAQCN